MPKKTPKLKLTEIEQKLVLGSLAQLQLAGQAYQRAQAAHQDEVERIAGQGFTLKQQEDGIYREKVKKD